MLYGFGPFVIDSDCRTLVREGVGIPLSGRAFDLLVLLVRARPKVISKEELLQTLWPDSFVTDGSLAQLVTEVRQALGDPAKSPKYVRTVHRYGYAFPAEAREEDRAANERCSRFFVLWRGQQVPLLRGENVIGRDAEAQIRLVSSTASRRHARIDVNGTQAVLSDLGSRNGTYVGTRRVTNEQQLADGDQIVIGDDVIVFCGANAPTTTRTGNVVKTDVR